jgi:multicomponent Na+:H+ antiporter subunit G
MTELHEWLSAGLIVGGLFFMLVGSIGVVRLPDFYARTHAVGKADNLGILLVILALVVHEGYSLNSAKLMCVLLFVAFANPVGTHALARAAWQAGQKPLLVDHRKPAPRSQTGGEGSGS